MLHAPAVSDALARSRQGETSAGCWKVCIAMWPTQTKAGTWNGGHVEGFSLLPSNWFLALCMGFRRRSILKIWIGRHWHALGFRQKLQSRHQMFLCVFLPSVSSSSAPPYCARASRLQMFFRCGSTWPLIQHADRHRPRRFGVARWARF